MSVQELSLSRIAVVAEGISTHAERNGIIVFSEPLLHHQL